MTRVRLLSYGPSRSALALARGLGVLKLRNSGSRYVPRSCDIIINWGRSTGLGDRPMYVNSPEYVSSAANKLRALHSLYDAGVTVPDYTVCQEQAQLWADGGDVVVARHCLRGHSGEGIEICPSDSEVPQAPLYTKYVKKLQEYRVHVVNGEVIDTQRKMRSSHVPDEEVNWRVRNYCNGFVFGREDVQPDERRDSLAVQAVAALDLDFGAVDIIHNASQDRCYVLEVNTAPGLTGTTLTKYIQAFTHLLEEL